MLNQRFSAVLLVTIAATAVSSVLFTYGLLSGSRTVTSQGTINAIAVGVYGEAACINPVSAVDWGELDPGATMDVTVYIRNEGTVPMTLSMTTDEWVPSEAAADLTLSWNREGSQVNPQAVVQATLTLAVSSSISDVTDFSFEITITGTE
jgi:hypothetical protein